MKNLEKMTKKQLIEYNIQLEQERNDFKLKLENLTEAIRLMQKQKFSSSSEKTQYAEGFEQMNLFNEAESQSNAKEKEPDIEEVKTYTRRKWKGQKEAALKDLPVETVICELNEEESKCQICETQMEAIGKEKVRSEVEYIPAKLVVKEYYSTTYSCKECLKESDEAMIKKSEVPKPVIKRSVASPSSVANVMYQKYVNGVPLYRQEKDWERIGFKLVRSVMANWVIICAEGWLKPLYNELHKTLLEEEVIMADETTVQVLKEPGKKPSTNSYMWLYRTGGYSRHPVILYEYKSSRSGEHARRFLTGFEGYLITDGYTGYEKVTGAIRCMCYAHVRRYFHEAMPQGENAKDSKAAIGLEYCNKLFKIEQNLKELTEDKRKKERIIQSKPVIGAFFAWANTVEPLNRSKLAKAINYALNNKKYLENFLLDGRIEISNNLSENSIRPFVIARKNFLFSDTPKGAEASSIVFSIIETAKANKIKPFEYLV